MMPCRDLRARHFTLLEGRPGRLELLFHLLELVQLRLYLLLLRWLRRLRWLRLHALGAHHGRSGHAAFCIRVGDRRCEYWHWHWLDGGTVRHLHDDHARRVVR
jgi:hypothetical protein